MEPDFKAFGTGFYGGCLDPLHAGHESVIRIAAGRCERLFVAISTSPARDRVPYAARRRALGEYVASLGALGENIEIFPIGDNAPDKDSYGPAEWEDGARQVKACIGGEPDAVFMGGTGNLAEFVRLYPRSELVNAGVLADGGAAVSSSRIWADPIGMFKYISRGLRPLFCRRILVLGEECSGKSTLVNSLAAALGGAAVPETGKEMMLCAGIEPGSECSMNPLEVALAHLNAIGEACKEAPYAVVDTDVLTTALYIPTMNPVTASELNMLVCPFDLVLWCEPVDFVQDGTRAADPAVRAVRGRTVRDTLLGRYPDAHRLSGTAGERLARALDLVRALPAKGLRPSMTNDK